MKRILLIVLLFSVQPLLNAQNIFGGKDGLNTTTDPKMSKSGISVSEVFQSGGFPGKASDTLGLTPFWQNELDNIGRTHNEALDFAFQRLRTSNLAGLTSSGASDLVASLASEFYTNRYGSILSFSQAQLKKKILDQGITPLPPVYLNISDPLRNTVGSISEVLAVLPESQTPADFENQVTSISNAAMGGLGSVEQTYLKAYTDVITKSVSYWDENAYNWESLSNRNGKPISMNRGFPGSSTITGKDFHLLAQDQVKGFSAGVGLDDNEQVTASQPTKQRHPCLRPIAIADGGGILNGAISGCVAGALFGAGVGCIPAAIFWAGVRGVSASIGAGIACIIMEAAQ